MKEKKTHKVLKWLLGVIIILILIVGGYGIYLGIDEAHQETKLEKEIAGLLSKNIETDEISTSLISHGEYKKVEQTLKNYLKEYSNSIKNMKDLSEDEEIYSVLSFENFEKDGKDFITTKELLKNVKQDINPIFDKVIELSSEEYVLSLITTQNLEKEYVEFYKNNVLTKDFKDQLEYRKEDAIKAKEELTNLINQEEKIINLLIMNKDKWTLNNNKVIFDNDEILNEYLELTDQIGK